MTTATAEEDTDTEEPVPPDGGYGWVIVASVFSVTFLSFGIIYSIGIMFDVLMADFNCSKSEITVVASIALCMQCFLGPFVSLLQQRFSTRLMVLTGIVIVAIGFILSAFATNLYVLYLTIGVLGGLGMALIYLPVTVIISFYFCRQRSLATALGGIGSYVGCFVHPYLIRFLISLYNWQGALLVLGALELNSLAAALLLRPVPVKKIKKVKTFPEKVGETMKTIPESPQDRMPPSDSSYALAAFIEENIAGCKSATETTDQQTNQEQAAENASPNPNQTLSDEEESSVNAISDSKTGIELTGMSAPESLVDVGRESSPSPAKRLLSFTKRQSSQGQRLSSTSLRRKAAAGQRQISEQQRPTFKESSQVEPASLQHRFSISASSKQLQQQTSLVRTASKISRLSSFHNLYTSDVLTLPDSAAVSAVPTLDETTAGPPVLAGALFRALSRQRSKTSDSTGRIQEETLLEDVKETAEPGPSPPAETKQKGRNFFRIIAPYFIRFKNPKFTSFFTTNLMKGLIYYTPSMFIVGWGKQLGLSVEQTTLLMSLVGIGNIIGRPAMAFLGDLLADHRMALLAVMVGINGTVTTSTVLFPNFYYLAFFVFQFAFFIGGGQTLLTPILADMMPLSELAFAFGILIAAEGVAILVGPPLLGLFPSYPATFAAAGLILLSSGIVLIVVAYVDRIYDLICRCFTRGKKPERRSDIAAADA